MRGTPVGRHRRWVGADATSCAPRSSMRPPYSSTTTGRTTGRPSESRVPSRAIETRSTWYASGEVDTAARGGASAPTGSRRAAGTCRRRPGRSGGSATSSSPVLSIQERSAGRNRSLTWPRALEVEGGRSERSQGAEHRCESQRDRCAARRQERAREHDADEDAHRGRDRQRPVPGALDGLLQAKRGKEERRLDLHRGGRCERHGHDRDDDERPDREERERSTVRPSPRRIEGEQQRDER